MGKNKRNEKQKIERLGEERLNNQGCLMKVVVYNEHDDITVQFLDAYKAEVHTSYNDFIKGSVKNPYYSSVYGMGIIGVKYPARINGEKEKEYKTWHSMLQRCFDEKYKETHPSYKNVTCCDEWLLYENFYEWIHSQENFDKWHEGKRWGLDKDIIKKGNKVYSPETCCLVPHNVNSLFTKSNATRGKLPIGITKNNNAYECNCRNPLTGELGYIGLGHTIEEAFQLYKKYKENIIKQVAKIEYGKGNITKECYGAMMNYKVEITD